MKRREFITLLGGAAVAWPLAARAQQAAMPTIGFLRSTSLADASHLVTSFRQGLQETGYVEGRNVAIEYLSAEDHLDRLPDLATYLISRRVAVIVGNHNAALAAKATTTTVPVVFATGADPVRDGLVASLNRPGGNVTGVSFLSAVLGAKRLELLRQLVPRATTIAVLVGPHTPDTEVERRDVQAAAQAIGSNSLLSMLRATATSRQPSRRSSSAALARSSPVWGRSRSPIGNGSSRSRPDIGFPQSIRYASLLPPVA